MIADLLTQHSGPLTAELVREPGAFGLGQVPSRLKPTATANLICGYCATGCSLKAHLRDGEAINLTANVDYPVNIGMACPKGWEALAPLDATDRGTVPLLKGVPTDWNTAASVFAKRMKSIIAENGAESVAVLSTGQITVEEMAFLGAFAKFGMGIRHLDSNTRQCMATAATAYKQSFGFDAPPFTYADFEESDVLVFIGANPCIAHPIMWQRALMNKHNPKIVVIDPRRTETAMAATHHYALRPKSDLTLLYGLARLLIEIGAVKPDYIEAHTTGFNEFADFLATFDVNHVSDETGISCDQLRELAELIAASERVSFWWTMGVNQGHEGTRTAQAIINIALMTGNMGRPGTGANSITGQCNAMGSRLFANATSLIGHHDAANPAHRAKVASVLGIDEAVISQDPSLAYDQILDRVLEGSIKALWVVATNGAHSWINSQRFAEAMKKLDLLVVQDMYPTTDTAKHAHLYLPAAGWGEKDGTFINAERRIGVIRKVRRAPGQALSDFNILRLLAHTWECGPMFHQWSAPEAVFQLLKKLSKDQPCDFSGIADYAMIEANGGIQWPCPTGDLVIGKERRLFEDGRYFHADGRAKFLFDAPRPMPEATDASFPLVLLTGRGSSAQWHTNTRTGKSDILKKLHPQHCYIEVNPHDAAQCQITAQGRVNVSSRRGTISAVVVVTPCVQRGQCFMPMHFEEVNRLTFAAFDPHSRQPSYKASAVRLSLCE